MHLNASIPASDVADVPAAKANPAAPLPLAVAERMLEGAGLAVCLVQDERVVYANAAACQLVRRDLSALAGMRYDAFVAPDHRPQAQAAVLHCLEGGQGRWGEFRALRPDGAQIDVRAHMRAMDFNGRPAVLITMLDVSVHHAALRQASWNAQMLARTEALSRTGSMEVEWPACTVRLSSGLRALLGQPDAAGTPTHLSELDWIPPEERAYVVGIWQAAVPGEAFEFQHRVACRDGTRLTVLHRGALVPDGPDRHIGVALLQDITAQRDAEQRIQQLASQDEVTGLPNRASLLDHLDAAMHATRWSGGQVMLMALEVPQIAAVKTSMGYGAGDTLAMTLAARLRAACGEHEAVCQIADGEFALVVEAEADVAEPTLRDRVAAIVDALAAPVNLGSTTVFAQCLAGLALYPRDAESPGALLEAAQAARLGASDQHPVAVFQPEVNQRAMRTMRLEAGLRQALAGFELDVHYQPQVDLVSGAIVGAEALLRWSTAELGEVSPTEFIPVAERSGLIGALGDWALRRVCADIAGWQRQNLPRVRVAINLSPAELQRPDLAARFEEVLSVQGLDPSCLTVEVTEGVVMAENGVATQVLQQLKDLGLEIALDDFGTGYSSLSQLSRLPIDVIKVDRSFVHDVMAPVEDVSVTRAVINMAHGLKMQVLAEGVETEGQLSLLASHGCDRVQGFLFSEAVSADAFAALLQAGKRLPEHLLAQGRKRRTLLLVDDEENILSALRRLLRRDGYTIVTANSGAEGLKRLAEQEIDVILTDQRMPGMTGVELLHRARALYPDTVRMVLSGYTELQSIIDAINEGAIYKFLTKPWDDERLRGHVAEAFRQKELVDENRRLALQVETVNADLASVNSRLEQLLNQQRAQSDILAASAGSMRQLVEELPAPLVAVDTDGQIAFVNHEAQQRLPGAMLWIGRHVRDAWPPALAELAQPDGPAAQALVLDGQHFDVVRRHLPLTDGAPSLLLLFAPTDTSPAP